MPILNSEKLAFFVFTLFLIGLTPFSMAGDGPNVGKPILEQSNGDYINVKMNRVSESPRDIIQFHYTNDTIHEEFSIDENIDGIPSQEYPLFLISKENLPSDHWGVYKVERPSNSAVIIDQSGSISDHTTGGCVDAASGNTCTSKIQTIVDLDFDTSSDIRNRCGDDGENDGGESCTINFDTGTYDNRDYDGRCPITGLGNPCLDTLQDGQYSDHNDASGEAIFQGYAPAGEIIVAASNEANMDNYNLYKFHSCYDDVDGGSEGKIVYFQGTGDNPERKVYECQTGYSITDGDWEEIPACGDDIDNDGDGAIDGNDPGCAGSSTETGDNCNPRIDTTNNHDEKVVLYDSTGTQYQSTTNQCTYGSADSTLGDDTQENTGSPELFRCSENSGLITGTYNGDYESRADTFCSEITWNTISNHDQIPAVEYYVPRQAMPIGENSWATSGSFNNIRYQSLHTAESYADNTDDEKHAVETWENRNMTDLGDGYNQEGDNNGAYNNEWSDYMDSWTIGNASISNSEIQSGGTVNSPVTQDDVFDGGFAGRCPTGEQWKWETTPESGEARWMCSGSFDWEPNFYLPDIESPEGMITGETTIALFLDTTIFDSSGSQSFEEVYVRNDAYSGRATLETITLQCWAGSSSTPPSQDSLKFTTTESLPSSSSNLARFYPITGTIDMTENDRYTCDWSFETSNGDIFDTQGNPDQLSRNDFTGDGSFADTEIADSINTNDNDGSSSVNLFYEYTSALEG